MPNVSQLVPVLGGSCNTTDGCAPIPNSTCNSTCVCEQDFVEGTTNKTCLPGTLTYRMCWPRRVWLHVLYKKTSRNFAHFPEFCFMYCSND